MRRFTKYPSSSRIAAAVETISSLDINTRKSLAHHSDDFRTLRRLADDELPSVRQFVAYNPHTTSNILSKLAKDSNVIVREAVAKNVLTPINVLAKLAKQRNAGIQVAVASNPTTSPDTLIELANVENMNVQAAVAQNVNTPESALITLANNARSSYVKMALLDNKYCPDEIVERFNKDSDKYVRNQAEFVLRNRSRNQSNI